MKRIFGATVALAILALFISSAQAVIKIEVAEMQNGVAFIKGNGAQLGAQITWEGGLVTTANNKNGGFSFFGVLPADCFGELSDGNETGDVHVLNCTPVSAGGGLSKTGQTQCWNTNAILIDCVGTGQDGELQTGAQLSYTDNGDGTITDKTTGLIWEKLTDDGSIHDWNNVYTWDQAFQKITDLNLANFAGSNEWRLPNVRELLSIVNYGAHNPAVSAEFNTNCVPGCTGNECSCTYCSPAGGNCQNDQGGGPPGSFRYWSSTTFSSRFAAFCVDFLQGNAHDNSKNAANSARAVRGP
jgi:Protein of unknown function (DUF1566)